MKRFISLFALCIILVGCGGSENTPASSPAATPTVAPVHFYKVGETATVQPWEITLQSAKLVDPAAYLPSDETLRDAKPDDRLLVLVEHVKNISSQLQPWSSTQLHLQNDTGNSDYSFVMEGKDIVGPISPTMQGSGQQAYIVPGTLHLFYWTYTNNDGLHQVIWKIDV